MPIPHVDPRGPRFGAALTTIVLEDTRPPHFAQTVGGQWTPYSVVIPSKCSLSASASARVWWTTPSRWLGGA
jgi:hypothetical protein